MPTYRGKDHLRANCGFTAIVADAHRRLGIRGVPHVAARCVVRLHADASVHARTQNTAQAPSSGRARYQLLRNSGRARVRMCNKEPALTAGVHGFACGSTLSPRAWASRLLLTMSSTEPSCGSPLPCSSTARVTT